MELNLPLVIGHRGAAADAPENTIAGLRAALEQGINWVEFDVKMTRDEELILFHDDTLERTTNGSGAVATHDLADILELDAGSWFSEEFVGEKIATFEAALDFLLEHDMGFNLEIKPCEGRERETAEAAMDMVTRIWPMDATPPLISSFKLTCLEAAHELVPAWPRGLLLDKPMEDWEKLADYIEAASIHCNAKHTTRERVEEYIDSGRQVLCYTVNDPIRARELISWGVDSLFSDTPGKIKASIQH